MTDPETTISFEHSKQFVLTVFEGHLDHQKVLASFEKIVNSPQYRKGMSRIWDVSRADLSELSPDLLEKLARYSTLFPSGVSDVKVAIVSECPDNITSAKLFAVYSEATNSQVRSFESLQKAIHWVTP